MRKSNVSQINKLNDDTRRRALRRTELITKHEIPNLPNKDFEHFNNIIGNPKHPATGKRSPILPFQFIMHNRIKEHRKTITNKSRKVGSSEIHLRTIAECSFDELIDHGVMIVFGNRQNEANKFIDDFDALFYDGLTDLDGKEWGYNDIITKKKSNRIELCSSTYLEAYPADPTALRSQKQIRWVFISEAAHVKRLDDSKVYNAVHPNIANDPMAYFTMESTPNGKRGFFYDQAMLAQQKLNEYDYFEYPYKVAEDTLITKEFIELERNNPKIDFEQEYNCKFTTSQSAALDEELVNSGYKPMTVTNWDDIISKR
jgi:hypothetical protein